MSSAWGQNKCKRFVWFWRHCKRGVLPSEGQDSLGSEELDVRMCISRRSCGFPNLLSQAGYSVSQIGSGC